MLFRQLVDDDLGCAAYLVGDEHAGVAVAVDPPYAVEPMLALGEHHGVRVVAVLETHTHADHVSGHGRLGLELGLTVRIHEAAGAEYPHEPLQDGTEVVVGEVVLRTIHTPGHRPEHCAFAVIDRSRGDEPWLVLTGDSLFVGDAARPDLAVEAQEGAEGLYRSLHRLVELGDGVEVFPGHVAGSLCGPPLTSATGGYDDDGVMRIQFKILIDKPFFDGKTAGRQQRPCIAVDLHQDGPQLVGVRYFLPKLELRLKIVLQPRVDVNFHAFFILSQKGLAPIVGLSTDL